MSWDIDRRDGRTAVSCNEIITLRGRIISESKETLTLETTTDKIKITKGSFRYDELPRNERFFILAKKKDMLKLVDYL